MLWVRNGGLPGRKGGFLDIEGFLATVGFLAMKGSPS